jgi:SNF2 family DNA or RNA helicase
MPSEPERGRIAPGVFLLADQVGCGKTKQLIDAAQVVYEAGEIDTVVVVCPAFARGVWADPNPKLGEVAKHSWPSVPYALREYSVLDDDAKQPKVIHSNVPRERLMSGKFLRWVVTNYEFMRRKERLGPLLQYLAGRRYWLVADEGWALSSHSTAQFKAVEKLIRPLVNAPRKHQCKRVTILNGSPADNPLDLFAQFRLLDRSILETKVRDKKGRMVWSGFVDFRARYAQLRPNSDIPQVVGYQNLEELREKTRPYILRRTTRECWDLPPVLDPVLVEAPLSTTNWKIYKQMRDEMVAWLDTEGGMMASVTGQAIVRGLRLMQITSGFLGGVMPMDMHDVGELDFGDDIEAALDAPPVEKVVKELGREKLDAAIKWIQRLDPQPDRLIIWCHFRPEIERTGRAIAEELDRDSFLLYGQQKKDERARAVAALNPDIEPDGPLAVAAQPQAGGAALNLAGASIAICLSQSSSLRVRNQRNGRIDRPGQKNPIRYVDVVATGPKGQRTIDHHILAALRADQDVADWTAATWRSKLLEE